MEKIITSETCTRQVKALTSAYVDLESMEHCLSCSEEYRKECKLYTPIKNGGDLRYKHLKLYEK